MNDDRLKGWKEVAEFLHVGDRTAQRWEHSMGLPIHRLETARSVVVFASRAEVEAWLQSSEGKRASAEEPGGLAAQPSDDGESSEEGTGEPSAAAATQGVPSVVSPLLADSGDRVDINPDRRANLLLRRRSRLLWLCGIALAGLLILLSAVAKTQPTWWGRFAATSRSASPRSDGNVAPAAGHGLARSVLLRLSLADGRTVTIGVSSGVLATCALAGRPTYAFTAEPVQDAMRVHIFRIAAPKPDGNREIVKCAAVTLRPGDVKKLRGVPDVVAIGWAVPSPRR